jgi:hypothetical protein
MNGGRVSTTGLEMPPDFPIAPYEAIFEIVHPYAASDANAYGEFGTGWNALAWRYAAVADHDEAFTESLRIHGGAPQAPARYRQEDQLFTFFAAGISALETFAYGTWAVAWATPNPAFALSTSSEQRRVSLRSLCERVEQHHAAEQLAVALRRTVDSAEFIEWTDVRNALTHRGGPGRHHALHLPGDVRSSAWGRIELNEQTTASRRVWLSRTLNDLLTATETFARDRLQR